MPTGGQLLVHALIEHGVDRVFCVPGESYVGALRALRDVAGRIQLVICRQEGGAAYMAEAYARASGRPGVCFVTRGPGATNASIGVHSAMQAATPMLLLAGQVPREEKGSEAFQEIDFETVFGSLAKAAREVSAAARVPEAMGWAFEEMGGDRPGPVVLSFPEDVLEEEI